MAPTIPQPLMPLLSQHRTKTTTTTAKFLISRNPAHKWTNTNNNNNNNNNALGSPRLTYFHHPHLNPVHLPLSLCHRFFLPRHPLRLLRRLFSPPFRHSLTLMMTTSQATASDSTQPTNKMVSHFSIYIAL